MHFTTSLPDHEGVALSVGQIIDLAQELDSLLYTSIQGMRSVSEMLDHPDPTRVIHALPLRTLLSPLVDQLEQAEPLIEMFSRLEAVLHTDDEDPNAAGGPPAGQRAPSKARRPS